MALSHSTPFTSSSVRETALGSPYDGLQAESRCWKYAENGGTQADPGKLMVAADVVANHIDLSFTVAPAVGDRQVTVTLGATAVSADDYRDGFVNVQDGTGEGRAYGVEGHPAAASAGNLVLDLKENVRAAGATGEANVNLVKNLYKDVVISAVDQADVPVGVFNETVPANQYSFIQTWGPAPVWQDEAVAIGDMVTIGTGAAGQVEADDAAGEPLIGIQGHNTGVATEYQMVYLKLDR